MNSKLNPCPFCGKEAIICEEDGDYYVRCGHCGGRGGIYSEERATEMWNRRADNKIMQTSPAGNKSHITACERELRRRVKDETRTMNEERATPEKHSCFGIYRSSQSDAENCCNDCADDTECFITWYEYTRKDGDDE